MKRIIIYSVVISTLMGIFFIPQNSFAIEDPIIKRDEKGVWFIEGISSTSLFYVFKAMGYAVATDRLWQAEVYRRTGRGCLSEIFGPNYLSHDIWVRKRGYSDGALSRGYESLSPEAREIIDGYVAGFNERIIEIEYDVSLLPAEFIVLGKALQKSFFPDLWDYKDVLAWGVFFQRSFDPEASEIFQIENAALLAKLTKTFGGEVAVNMFEDLRVLQDSSAVPVFSDDTKYKAIRTSLKRSVSLIEKWQHAFTKPSFKNYTLAASDLTKERDENYKKLKGVGGYIKMGSYAWVVSGAHTESGGPILYSGPQLGFDIPSICLEGSISAGGIDVSGMAIAGIPGIIIGRTPHHAWSMQVGHAHTTDYYIESITDVKLDRVESISITGQPDQVISIYKTTHGPVIYPLDFDFKTVRPSSNIPIISWKYAQAEYEFDVIDALYKLTIARSMDQFSEGVEMFGVSQHICYADRDGNIAYWMSGRDPIRPKGEWRLPQGIQGPGTALEWDASKLIPRSTHRNSKKGYYGGWNNKSNPQYSSGFNSPDYLFGPAHRTHVIEDYFSQRLKDDEALSFEEIRDLGLNVATTHSLLAGGNLWRFVQGYFKAAVLRKRGHSSRKEAIKILDAWDGHFVKGGADDWADGKHLAEGNRLVEKWVGEVLDGTFSDEGVRDEAPNILFNVLLRSLAGENAAVPVRYNWFSNVSDQAAPQTADEIIVSALDRTLSMLGKRPWGLFGRGKIVYRHALFENITHTTPLSVRSAYAHCVEYGKKGPRRIESMFPLGQSGDIRFDPASGPVVSEHFFSMAKDDEGEPILFDLFEMREFYSIGEDE